MAVVDQLVHWRVSGVIGELRGRDLTAGVTALGVPCVNVSSSRIGATQGRVTLDNHAIGALVANYFIDRRYMALACVGFAHGDFSELRERGFREAAVAHGVSVSTFASQAGQPHEDWRAEDEAMASWMRGLPRPVGVLAINDGLALKVVEVARTLGIDVPGDVAVVGVDNDELVCETARPPLSSVALPLERLGYEAAAMLRDLLAGRPCRGAATELPPIRVVTRGSSDALAIRDPDLAGAVRFIREHAHVPLRADSVAREVAISRRALERRFRSHLGRTLLQEIHRAHVEAAKQLLVHTDLPMPEVAAKAGFTNDRVLSTVFRKLVGTTPGAYRQQHRLRDQEPS